MRLAIITGFVLATSAASANVMLPKMRLRNGLTDEQYDALFAAGKNPTIDANTARDWMYRAYRYENVKEWLDLIGKTNNFAALAARVPVIQDELSAMSKRCITVMQQNVNLEATRDNFARIINTKNEIIDDMSGRIEFVSAKIMDSYADATNNAAKAKLLTTKEMYNKIAEMYLSIYDHLNPTEDEDQTQEPQ